MERTKIGFGLLLLAVSSAVLFAAGEFGATWRMILGAASALGLAVGTLLVGTAGSGRPV